MTTPHDALIRCGAGCGRALSFARLQEGRRHSYGILCETCAGERVLAECVRDLGFTGEEAQAWTARLSAKIVPPNDAAD